MRLEIDEFSAIFSISVWDAALLLALDQGRFDSVDFTEQEIEPFLSEERVDVGNESGYRVWREIHNLLSIPPIGNVKRARDDMLRNLLRSLASGELKAESVRRTLDGTMRAEDTFLDLGALQIWADERELDLSDLWHTYGDSEDELAERVRSVVSDRRDIWSSGGEVTRADETFDNLPDKLKAEYLRLAQENLELRKQQKIQGPEIPASPKLTNNLLRILVVLLSEHYPNFVNTPYKVAGVLESIAQRRGIRIGDDTIAARIKECIALLPRNN